AEVPQTVKDELEFVFVKNMRELVKHALDDVEETTKKGGSKRSWGDGGIKKEVEDEVR
ncbi:MAG: hypothetical protein AAFP70_01395, partial [Calditrichota bacterium]